LLGLAEMLTGIDEAFILIEELNDLMERIDGMDSNSVTPQEAVSPNFTKKNGFDIWSKHWKPLNQFLNRDHWRRYG
jgi:hypothetical protein